MADIMVGGILLAMIGGAIVYIRKAKKSGVKCIGCPACGNCPSKSGESNQCTCGCHK